MSANEGTRRAPGNWHVLLPDGARVQWVPRGRPAHAAAAASLADLAPGTTVALLDAAPGGRRRCRRLARRAGVRVQREYVALPRLPATVLLVEDAAQPVRYAWNSLVTPPPGVARLHALTSFLILLARTRLPGRVLGLIVPGRVVLGVRA